MQWTDIVIRLGMSILIGMLIGMERERNHRPAGVKTHILVCMGATLISMIQAEMMGYTVEMIVKNPELANSIKIDLGRMGAQVVSGIGFLGAGTILRTRGGVVKGLTTAATLWMVACIGLAIGMGYYKISIAASVLVLLMLFTLKLIQTLIRNRVGEKIIEVKFINKKDTMKMLNDYFIGKMIEISHIEMVETELDEADETAGNNIFVCNYTILLPRHTDLDTVVSEISMEDNVFSVREFI